MKERLSEEELIAKASKWNLKLMSDYKDYKNKNSILDLMCKNCGHEFLDSVNNLRGLKYPCGECRKRERSLYFDNTIRFKECSRCSRILSYSNFPKQSGLRGANENAHSYKWICKECDNKFKLIKRFKKKYRLIYESFNGMCDKCKLGLNFLQVFHFHHPDINFKTMIWDEVKDRLFSYIHRWANQDRVIPLCSNCHAEEDAKTFLKFKSLILKSDLFAMSAELVDQLLDKVIHDSALKYEVKEWIRKRYIIEKVFGGSCIGCGNVNVFNNLPSIVFHHLDFSKKEINIKDVLNFDCEVIYDIILKEIVICLCSNCHSIIHSDLNKFIEEFFQDEYFQKNFSESYLEGLKLIQIKAYNNILKNISKFKFKKIEIKSPLKLEFNQTQDIWKIHLLEVFSILNKINQNYIRVSDIMKIFDYKRMTAMKFLNGLTKRGYLNKYSLSHSHVRYDLTVVGLKEAIELSQKHKRKVNEINNIIIASLKE